ncbi:hypothetical protein ACIRD9_23635 [Streptomyces violaceus]|uniref:hypothetical protein n=1 Tax=Streptomyces violaceus TaxID=1936 RepID=UPI0038166E49
MPASLCGAVGIKPSAGASRTPTTPTPTQRGTPCPSRGGCRPHARRHGGLASA